MGTNSINRFLIDSTVLIDLSRGNGNAIDFIDGAAKDLRGIAVSVISSMELIVGCRDKVELKKTLTFLSRYPIIDISTATSKTAYQLLINYNKSHGLVIPDAFIAATALEEDLTLVSSNIRHFEMISGLIVQKPY